jgi:A/G-specific adenine glycosylase
MKKESRFNFTRLLLKWDSEKNTRQMPWKGEKDPYKIWLSEIMLQQTRVEQGIKYYENFLKAFPDIHKLANTDDNKIYKLWEGLGYYNRCKNLITTARHISKNLKGKFPDKYDEIKKLKGVGPYTAAAIASFAFNTPHAVVDGNVHRVFARIFGVRIPIDSSKGKNFFSKFAQELLDKKNPAKYNQAIMDFGAVICKPAPLCTQCTFLKNCKAFNNNEIFDLPVKIKKINIRKRWFYYILMEYKGKIAIHQRIEKDIWHNLFEFILIESAHELNHEEVFIKTEKEYGINKSDYEIESVSQFFHQKLSHQLIDGQFIKLKLKRKPNAIPEIIWVSNKKMKEYTFPGLINHYFQTHSLK